MAQAYVFALVQASGSVGWISINASEDNSCVMLIILF